MTLNTWYALDGKCRIGNLPSTSSVGWTVYLYVPQAHDDHRFVFLTTLFWSCKH